MGAELNIRLSLTCHAELVLGRKAPQSASRSAGPGTDAEL